MVEEPVEVTVEELVEVVVEEPVEIAVEDARQQPQLEGIDFFRKFDSEVHVVVDPGLRIPIERFHER